MATSFWLVVVGGLMGDGKRLVSARLWPMSMFAWQPTACIRPNFTVTNNPNLLLIYYSPGGHSATQIQKEKYASEYSDKCPGCSAVLAGKFCGSIVLIDLQHMHC